MRMFWRRMHYDSVPVEVEATDTKACRKEVFWLMFGMYKAIGRQGVSPTSGIRHKASARIRSYSFRLT